MSDRGLTEKQLIDETFIQILSQIAADAMQTYKINEKALLFGWASSRDRLVDRIKLSEKDQTNIRVTTENIRELIEGENTRLTCISISDSYTIKQLVIDLSSDFLQKRKRQFKVKFKVKPYILFVFDEAQEFVRDLTNARGIERIAAKKLRLCSDREESTVLVDALQHRGSPTSTQMPCSSSIPTLSVHCPGLMIETW
jgi:hypothetical protein